MVCDSQSLSVFGKCSMFWYARPLPQPLLSLPLKTCVLCWCDIIKTEALFMAVLLNNWFLCSPSQWQGASTHASRLMCWPIIVSPSCSVWQKMLWRCFPLPNPPVITPVRKQLLLDYSGHRRTQRETIRISTHTSN